MLSFPESFYIQIDISKTYQQKLTIPSTHICFVYEKARWKNVESRSSMNSDAPPPLKKTQTHISTKQLKYEFMHCLFPKDAYVTTTIQQQGFYNRAIVLQCHIHRHAWGDCISTPIKCIKTFKKIMNIHLHNYITKSASESRHPPWQPRQMLPVVTFDIQLHTMTRCIYIPFSMPDLTPYAR